MSYDSVASSDLLKQGWPSTEPSPKTRAFKTVDARGLNELIKVEESQFVTLSQVQENQVNDSSSGASPLIDGRSQKRLAQSEYSQPQSTSVMSEFHNFTRRHDLFEASGVSSVQQATPISKETQM